MSLSFHTQGQKEPIFRITQSKAQILGFTGATKRSHNNLS